MPSVQKTLLQTPSRNPVPFLLQESRTPAQHCGLLSPSSCSSLASISLILIKVPLGIMTTRASQWLNVLISVRFTHHRKDMILTFRDLPHISSPRHLFTVRLKSSPQWFFISKEAGQSVAAKVWWYGATHPRVEFGLVMLWWWLPRYFQCSITWTTRRRCWSWFVSVACGWMAMNWKCRKVFVPVVKRLLLIGPIVGTTGAVSAPWNVFVLRKRRFSHLCSRARR